MSTLPESRRATKAELFARLAGESASGVTVVTPNRRLALALTREFDGFQAARGAVTWGTADILPLAAFIGRTYEDALYSDHEDGLPGLLTPAQEQALWENIIRASGPGRSMLAIPEAAALARDAWQLVHAWRLEVPRRNLPLNEDCKVFQLWGQDCASRTRRTRHTDGARVADVAASLLARPGIRRPQSLVHYGFDRILPQQSAYLHALAAAGSEILAAAPEPRGGVRLRVACADSGDEIRRAAAWARARLEANGLARIGIIVPELARHRRTIERVFSAVMEPDYALPGTPPRALPFNISLGEPLSTYPLVNAAFLALELGGRAIDFERASRFLRSPFLAGAEAEFAQRGLVDARLRQRAEPAITLESLHAWVARDDAHCPILAQRSGAFAEFRKSRLFGRLQPSTWARAFSDALAVIGFPGERSLDSAEFQTLAKWHELLAEFATLDRIVQRITYADALSRLRRMAADALFQPETQDVPIQVLGALEATAMEFDHLWVMGLSDEAWPSAPRPNPFLPVELQRTAGIPHGSAAAALDFARRLTAGWLASAGEVVLSHPRSEDDREFKPSPLIVGVPEHTLTLPPYGSYRDAVHGMRRTEHRETDEAPPLVAGLPVGGGTTVIGDQAACPFRAFARHRLGAESLKAPHAGLDAMERGTLVHAVLAQVWRELKTKGALDAMPRADLDTLLGQAADDALARLRRDRPRALSGRFAEIEKQRLVRLARAWLQVESNRGAFTVLATEERRRFDIGGLVLNARLDRVDQMDDGRRLVIDYKTGETSPGAMLGERPDEPQLPLYLVGAETDAAALAFAQVRAGAMRFAALARDGDLLPEVRAFSESPHGKRHGSWQTVVAGWRTELARLAAAFAAGDARVDPKRYPATCRNCDVKPFCRIYERLESALDEDAA